VGSLGPLQDMVDGLLAVKSDVHVAGHTTNLEKCLEGIDVELVVVDEEQLRAIATLAATLSNNIRIHAKALLHPLQVPRKEPWHVLLGNALFVLWIDFEIDDMRLDAELGVGTFLKL